jgi:5-formyltetrahydrofolate cyclo-ligase
MNKAALRKIYLQKRRDLLAPVFTEMEKRVIARLLSLPDLQTKQVIHTYLPLRDKKEIDTWPVVNVLWSDDRTVVIPSISSDGSTMNCLQLNPEDKLETLRWGLQEPIDKRMAAVDRIDVIIMPLLCFDKKGYRIGYGRGYYDQFLQTLRQDVLKIGLSIFEPVKSIEDTDTWDVPLDICITPDRTYPFHHNNQ